MIVRSQCNKKIINNPHKIWAEDANGEGGFIYIDGLIMGFYKETNKVNEVLNDIESAILTNQSHCKFPKD